MENNLPKGWEESVLSDIADWSSGGTPKSTESTFYNGTIPWLVIGDLNDGEIIKSEKSITPLGLENSNAKIVPGNSVLCAMYGSIGKLGIAKIPCATNQAIAYTRNLYGEIPYKYLFYYLFSLKKYLLEIGKGGTQSNISLTVLKNVRIPIPPLPEQQRIVAKLDSLFEKIESNKRRLEKIPQILKRFRQSVLSYAISGKLTNDQLRDELPKGWITISGKDAFEFITSGSRGWAKYYSDRGALFIRVTNLNYETIHIDTNLSKCKFVNPPKKSEGTRTKVKENDILISITGDVGMVGIVTNEFNEAFINQHVCLARPKVGFYAKYIAYFMTAENGGKKYFNEVKKGATKSGLGLDDIKNIPIQLPTLAEQKEIVRRVEQLFAVADKIEFRYNQAKAMLDKLPQSILAKAFRGELVPQDPNDEPASVLLKRIKYQRLQN